MRRSRAPHHRRIVAAELSEEATHVLLSRGWHTAISGGEEAASRNARGEPIATREPADERYEGIEQLVGAELPADVVKGVERLRRVCNTRGVWE